jgi:hypothetical protein
MIKFLVITLHCDKYKYIFFQFVNFHDSHQHRSDPDGAFALAALMEIPNQFSAMNDLGFFNNNVDVDKESDTVNEDLVW